MTFTSDSSIIPSASRSQLMPGWADPVTVEDLSKLRREIHRTPELGWSEFIATARLARAFAAAGFSLTYGPEFISPKYVRARNPELVEAGRLYALQSGVPQDMITKMGEYPGLIARWDTGRPGRTVAIRIELDALAVEEPENEAHLPYREGFSSMRRGMMHACGHDGHQAVAISLAKFIQANSERLTGRILFICQPAEEGSRGAYPILQSGVLKGIDVLFCGHIEPDLESGTVVASPTKLLSTTKMDFEFTGRASHAGSHPQTGRNALLAAANAAINIMALPRHEEGMTRVNVGQLHAGEGRNVVPSHAWMEIEVRGENGEVNRDLAAEALMRAQGAAMSFGVECRHRIVGEAIDFTPDASLAQMITVCARRARNCDRVIPSWPVNGSDDGTLLMRRVQKQGGRAGYFLVGGAIEGTAVKPAVDFDERALVTLYDTWTNLLVALLGKWS
ncbi:amidohydrolase [Sutterella sp.]|uniref:amidohydrolase n=1 Tax=Sutterella sp. TaxID=1981025 RepID=UPI0026E0889E|nr:amidohydrolase [Sutterella sp.]MDO5532142.1 amidohydrolase [Sutterella sp.]